MKEVEEYSKCRISLIKVLFGRLRSKWRNYKLRHLCIGKVKMVDKTNGLDFRIVKIDWDVHWQTGLYLTVIIRDYLRFFAENTPVIGNCVVEKKDPLYTATEEDWKNYEKKWRELVNSVADEFDEILRLTMQIETAEDISEIEKKKEILKKKAFSDFAYIYDDLWW